VWEITPPPRAIQSAPSFTGADNDVRNVIKMKQHKKIARAIAMVGVAAVSAALLAACSTEQPSSEGVTLTFAYPQVGAPTTWETMAASYEKETGVKVEVEAIPIDGYAQALNTRLQGGNAPDMFLTKPGNNGEGTGILGLGAAGLVGEVTGAAADLINPDEKGAYYVDGKAYGFPLFNAPRSAVVFNDNLKAAGVEWPTTIDEMLALCGPVKEGGLAFTLGQFGSSFTADGETLLIAASSVYVADPTWDQKRTAGEVTFSDSKGWRDAVQAVADMYKAGCFQDGAEAAGGEFWAGVAAGQTPAILSLTTGESDIWKDLTGMLPNNTFSVYAFPAAKAEDRRVINSVKYTLSYNAASKQQSAVQDYINWLAEPKQLQAIADLTGGVPAGKLTVDNLPAVYAPIAQFITDDQVVSTPGLLWPAGVLAALQEGVPGLFTGQKTVDQILADMDAAWNKK
jgi:raffinose/stachyose/melibiose transport system substrate-binding protein